MNGHGNDVSEESWQLDQPQLDPFDANVTRALEYFLSQIPDSREMPNNNPHQRSKKLIQRASVKAGVISGGLAVPAGPLGLLTILPDVVAIWKVQAQLAADVAGCFGKKPQLTRDEMLFCLFRHTATQIVRKLVIEQGGQVMIRRASLRVGDEVLCKVGIRCAQRFASRALVRALPLIGAGVVGAYAFYDTRKVGETCLEVFAAEETPDIRLFDIELVDDDV